MSPFIAAAPACHPLDRLGIGASLLCAVHCLAAPVALAIAPAVLGWWADPRVHLVGAVLVVPLAAVALVVGYRRHARRWVLGLGALGVVGILAGLLPPAWQPPALTWNVESAALGAVCCPTLGSSASGDWSLVLPWGSLLTTAGGLALIAAHVGNLMGSCRASAACPD